MLMIRLSRTRRNDSIFVEGRDDTGKLLGQRGVPPLNVSATDEILLGIPPEDLQSHVPSYEERRKTLARDALASVDGFRLLVQAAFRFLFGMRFCWDCPDCSRCASPCLDLCGRSCDAEGGIFGRAEAAYACIESQKSTGSLHAHIQVFIQCLHQHTPLADVLQRLKETKRDEVEALLKYKEHVCRQVYADPMKAEQDLPKKESSWPEYSDSKILSSAASYLTARCASMGSKVDLVKEGRQWLNHHLAEHVQELQELKQHHVHLPNEKGERVPLTHCRRSDNPNKCKGDFPRTHWLINEAVVLCPGLLKRMGMASSGRRSKLGSLHGPMNHENLNGTSAAMLAVQTCNSDVQLPYRLPISEATHARECDERCSGNSPAI